MPHPRISATGRTSGSWTPRIAGISAVVLVAVGGAIAYSVASSASASRSSTQLPGRVQSVQTVGIIGQVTDAVRGSTPLRQLNVTSAGLQFGPLPPASLPQGDPQWTADTIAGGTLVFIYAPNGRCLAMAGSQRRAVVALRRCDLGPDQRWQRVHATVQSDGHEYAQVRNLRSGWCLTAGDAAAGTANPPAFLTRCGPAAQERQLLSFWWSA
jgi:Ricin-type beta-trefoil lectin domain-like